MPDNLPEIERASTAATLRLADAVSPGFSSRNSASPGLFDPGKNTGAKLEILPNGTTATE
jgi:hypothetical protein